MYSVEQSVGVLGSQDAGIPERLPLNQLTWSTSRGSRSPTGSKSKKEFRPRAPNPKSRTGCVVCKIRRIKCDETKPTCIKCTSTGRKCEGYGKPAPRANSSRGSVDEERRVAGYPLVNQAISVPVALGSDEPVNEQRSLHLFWSVTEHSVARYFGTGFWGRLVLPAAHVYPTVRQSILAVSSVYEAYLNREHDSHCSQEALDTPTVRFGLIHYNKAVRDLQQSMSGNRLPLEAVLICCLLFTWLEILRNDLVTAFKHLKGGLLILNDLHHHENEINELIPHIFTRLQIQATQHGCPGSDFNLTQLRCPSELSISDIPSSFRDVDEARHCLDSKLVSVYQFMRSKSSLERARDTKLTSLSPEWPRLIAERDTHLRILQTWHEALRDSFHSSPAWSSDSPGGRILELNYRLAVLHLQNLLCQTEMEYDKYIVEFDGLVELVEHVLLACSQDGSPPSFSFDAGIIPGLFYTILKCRQSSTRHKALELLRHAPEREGIWHRDTIAAAGAFKIAIEESWDEEQMIMGRPPESARIYHEEVHDGVEQGKPAMVSFKGGLTNHVVRQWEIPGLISRLGDMM